MIISLRRWVIVIASVLVSLFLVLYFLPLPPLLKGIPFSQAVYDDEHHLLRLTLSQDDEYRLFVPLKKMPHELITATLLEEDQYFRFHGGVNPYALVKAGWQTYFLQSRRMGASTITMQVARMRYHIPSKKLIGKLQQILRALQIELHYSKNQILEAYLNLAPYGNNIQGVGAASLIYFGKPVNELILPEILTLTVMPQNPNSRTPLQGKKLKESRDKLFERWVMQHPEDNNKKNIIELPLQMQSIRSLPFLAPHFVNYVLEKFPDQREITTTLNVKIQKRFEQVIHQYLLRKKTLGVNNVAAMLVDTRDMGVKAWVGSADFFDKKIQGQVNGVIIKRSPGSTLKPFIYALALDQGLIHPNTVLKDAPHSFGTYNPENFDHDFMGPIKAKDALILSRNIPAIFLASQLSSPNLYQLLEDAHVSKLRSEDAYGLSLVLGGAEVSMKELTGLYAMLVNDGLWHSLRVAKKQSLDSGKRLLSPEASYLILDMLKETHLPTGYLSEGRGGLSVSWKTGTSSGFRDAWTLGSFGPYVMAIWIGNFDNTANQAFVGKEIAAPLFFEMISALQHEIGPVPSVNKNPKELNLEKIAVCKASGMLPTRYCKETELTWFIPGKSPIRTDTIFREIAIDKKTGLRACHYDQNTEFKIYEFWPSDLLKIFKDAGMQRRTPPPFDGNCLVSNGGINPEITSPRAQLDYVVSARTQSFTTIPLAAFAEADVAWLYWFVNETFLGKISRDQFLLWHAKPGRYVIRVVDDQGRSDVRDVVVKSN